MVWTLVQGVREGRGVSSAENLAKAQAKAVPCEVTWPPDLLPGEGRTGSGRQLVKASCAGGSQLPSGAGCHSICHFSKTGGSPRNPPLQVPLCSRWPSPLPQVLSGREQSA